MVNNEPMDQGAPVIPQQSDAQQVKDINKEIKQNSQRRQALFTIALSELRGFFGLIL
jgi:hypothetical protein